MAMKRLHTIEKKMQSESYKETYSNAMSNYISSDYACLNEVKKTTCRI